MKRRVLLVGGAHDRLTFDLDDHDVLPTIRVAFARQRLVVLTTRPDPADVQAVDRQWHTYHLWPGGLGDQARPLEYHDVPPRRPGGQHFASSA